MVAFISTVSLPDHGTAGFRNQAAWWSLPLAFLSLNCLIKFNALARIFLEGRLLTLGVFKVGWHYLKGNSLLFISIIELVSKDARDHYCLWTVQEPIGTLFLSSYLLGPPAAHKAGSSGFYRCSLAAADNTKVRFKIHLLDFKPETTLRPGLQRLLEQHQRRMKAHR